MPTPYRLAAEWEPQGAILMAWPQADSDWAPILDEARDAFQAIAGAVLRDQDLILCCNSHTQASELKELLTSSCGDPTVQGRLRPAVVPTNDTWARDFGPLTLTDGNTHRLVDPRFNAWGNKFESDLDNRVNATLQAEGAFGALPLSPLPIVIEGGALETDGLGTLLTTRHCLLHPNRNGAEATPEWMGQVLASHLGINRVLWLDHGALEGDDTDGHIDTLARFCAPGQIVYQGCDDDRDCHFSELAAMADELAALRDSCGNAYELTALPWPGPLYGSEGQRLPATYANFLITNESVLVPVYGVAADDNACDLLARCFPTRRIQPIPCRTLLEQGGSLHCLTMQLPPGVSTCA